MYLWSTGFRILPVRRGLVRSNLQLYLDYFGYQTVRKKQLERLLISGSHFGVIYTNLSLQMKYGLNQHIFNVLFFVEPF